MKKIAAPLLLCAALLAGCSSPTAGAAQSAPAPSTSQEPKPTATARTPIANYVGKNLKDAREALEASGHRVRANSVDGSAIILDGNWTVTAQKPAAGGTDELVTLTAKKAEKKPAAGEATKQGLTQAKAIAACTRAADAEYKYGVKLHWITGSTYELQSDGWFFKVSADITNAFGAKAKGMTLECKVSGTDAAPEVTELMAY